MAKGNRFESLVHHEERKAQFQAETDQKHQDEAAEATRVAEDKEISVSRELPKEGETREQLLERIRKMREEQPKEIKHEGHWTEGMMKRLSEEQEAGQAAVAKAQIERERNQAIAAAAAESEAAGEKKAG